MSIESQVYQITLKEHNANETNWSAPIYNSTDTQIHIETGAHLTFKKKSSLEQSQFTITGSQDGSFTTKSMSVQEVLRLSRYIDQYYMTTNYRKVIENQKWRELYQVTKRNFPYIDGELPGEEETDAIPCHSCGIVLPSYLITIDHTKPVSTGSDQAVLKVLRFTGGYLTHSGAHGTLYNALLNAGPIRIPTKRSVIRFEKEISYQKAKRYTLTDNGIIFLSAIISAAGEQGVINACMHSMINLRPFCSHCNPSKGNTMESLDGINTGIY